MQWFDTLEDTFRKTYDKVKDQETRSYLETLDKAFKIARQECEKENSSEEERAITSIKPEEVKKVFSLRPDCEDNHSMWYLAPNERRRVPNSLRKSCLVLSCLVLSCRESYMVAVLT